MWVAEFFYASQRVIQNLLVLRGTEAFPETYTEEASKRESHKHCLSQIGLPVRYKSMRSADWRAAITAFVRFHRHENHWQISIQIDAHAKCCNEHTGIASEHQYIPSTCFESSGNGM
jgi:hypothetical protein